MNKLLILWLIGLTFFPGLPDAYNKHHIVETVYLESASECRVETPCIRAFGINYCNVGDFIEWRFTTYNNSFLVKAEYWVLESTDKLTEAYSSSGIVMVTEVWSNYNRAGFSFQNIDSVGGYIRIEVEIITWKIIMYSVIGACSTIVGITIIILGIRRRKRKKKD
ncbi:MAG: hypothetical protein ACFFDC_11985 [Promethearchaeota archaeon]